MKGVCTGLNSAAPLVKPSALSSSDRTGHQKINSAAVQQKSHWEVLHAAGKKDRFQTFRCISSFRQMAAILSQLSVSSHHAARFFFSSMSKNHICHLLPLDSWCSWASGMALSWFLTSWKRSLHTRTWASSLIWRPNLQEETVTL